jgi:hypothetical protein
MPVLASLTALNDNKFFLGAMLILLNIGSRYLVDEYSTNPEEYDRNLVLRRLAVFAVCFVGTRDIVTSLLLTAGFVVLAQGVSRRSREGMRNEKVAVTQTKPEADNPAYDKSAPTLPTT